MSSAEPTEPHATASPATAEPRFRREITSIVALPFLIWIIGWTRPIVFAILVALTAVLGLWEFLTMAERKGLPAQKLLSLLLLAFLLVNFLLPHVSVEVAVFSIMLLIPTAYVFSRSDLQEALPASAVCILGILYIGLLSGAFMRLRIDFEPYGSELVFFLLLVVWASDSMAYYTGKNFGRTKLLPRVSPKKTVEGLVGGIAGSLIAATVACFTFFPQFPLVHALISAILLSVTGVVGDLAESAWKRSASVKDSGSLIPGHGGILDRLDSILFTAPILYAYWFLLNEPLALLTF